MERFFNNDEGSNQFFEDDDDENEEEQEDAVAYVDQEGLLEVMQMDLAQNELNQDLLAKAISIAEKSLFWRFRSTKSKMKEIQEIYKELVDMTNEEEK